MEVASLGLKVEAGSVKTAAIDLDKLTQSAGGAEAGVRRMASASVEADRHMQRLGGAVQRAAMQSQQLSFQLIDIGQSIPLAFQSPLYFAQNVGYQIAQIGQLYMGNGGVAAALRDISSMTAGFISKIWPLATATGALWAGWELVSFHLREGEQRISSATQALADQAISVDALYSRIGALSDITDEYARAIGVTEDKQDRATQSIVANSEREFNAKKSLLEIELKRQQAAIAAQEAEMAMAGSALRRSINIPTVTNDVAAGYSDPLIGQFVRAPYQDNLLQRTHDLIDQSGLVDKIKELRANLELSRLGTTALEDALKLTFSDSVAASVDALGSATTTATDHAGAYSDALIEAAQRAQREWEFFAGEFSGFWQDFRAGLMDGASLWGAFGDAAVSALDSIATRVLDMAADNIFNMLFSSFGSIAGGAAIPSGGFIPGITGPKLFASGGVFADGIGGYSNQVVNSPTVFAFAKGAGLMGEAGPEAIMPLKRGPDGRLGVESGASRVPNITFNVRNEAPGAEVEQPNVSMSGAGDIIVEMAVRRVEKNMSSGKYRGLGVAPGLRRT